MAALEQCPVQLKDIDAIAVTVRPGMSLTLKVGLTFAKELAKKHRKPLIPIHHMEAHALAVRLKHRVEFPYLVLLVSGGHCQLAVVQGVGDFLLLGQTLDDAPGEAFDKLSRRLKLQNIPECGHLSGGQAIEFLARNGDPRAFSFPEPMTAHRSCDFSFSGLKHSVLRQILRLEKKHGIEADALVPEVADMCASVQHAIAIHLLRRTQRAINYCLREGLLPSTSDSPDTTGPTLVVSGGVACNLHLRSMLSQLCETEGVTLVAPPKELCTDNGIMIAWNGVERWNASLGITNDLDSVDIMPRCSLGTNISASVTAMSIKSEKLRLKLD
ncbi:tRNA N6-adenosine threonylcarbamoyltransferase, mitochondrial-like isoform X2 [Ornithodoros turicata]